MNMELPSSEINSGAQRPNREWQFSLRSLFIATTALSIISAMGVYFVGVAFVLFVVILLQSATLLSADWLIRPGNRRVLAFVTAGSWTVFGSGLLIIACKQALELIDGSLDNEIWLLPVLLAVGAACCFG